MFRSVRILLPVLLLVAGPERVRAEGDSAAHPDLAAMSATVQALLPDCRAATVCVFGRFGVGSGVVVTTNGFVLTAGHVCGETNEPVTVFFEDGRTAKGRTLGLSSFTDTGLIRLDGEGPWPCRPMAPVNRSREGDWLFALGFPEGRFGQEERGVVLRVGRLLAKRPLVMQTDCKLIGGDSGGPLFDLRGEVVGIHSRISSPSDFNFHAPIEAFHREWKMLADSRQIRPTGSFLGVRMEAADKGVRITAVVAESAAASSGLRVGDVITHVEDEPTREPDEATVLIRTKAIDQPIKLDILRRGVPMTYIIRLGRWPDLDEEVRESRRRQPRDE